MIYRVFLVKTFRECVHFDIEASTARRAEGIAKRSAIKLLDSMKIRQVATDNGWIAEDEPTIVECAGYPNPKMYGTYEVLPGVYADKFFGITRYGDSRVVDARKK